LVTALVPSDTACLASSPGRMRRTAVWTQHPKPFTLNPPRSRSSKRRRRPKRRRQRSPKRRRRQRSRQKRRRLRPKRRRLPPPKSKCYAAHALVATSARRPQQPIQNNGVSWTPPFLLRQSLRRRSPSLRRPYTTHRVTLNSFPTDNVIIFFLDINHFCSNASSDQQTSISKSLMRWGRRARGRDDTGRNCSNRHGTPC